MWLLGLIEDPMADHRNRRMSSVWSDAEKKIFREELVGTYNFF